MGGPNFEKAFAFKPRQGTTLQTEQGVPGGVSRKQSSRNGASLPQICRLQSTQQHQLRTALPLRIAHTPGSGVSRQAQGVGVLQSLPRSLLRYRAADICIGSGP